MLRTVPSAGLSLVPCRKGIGISHINVISVPVIGNVYVSSVPVVSDINVLVRVWHFGFLPSTPTGTSPCIHRAFECDKMTTGLRTVAIAMWATQRPPSSVRASLDRVACQPSLMRPKAVSTTSA